MSELTESAVGNLASPDMERGPLPRVKVAWPHGTQTEETSAGQQPLDTSVEVAIAADTGDSAVSVEGSNGRRSLTETPQTHVHHQDGLENHVSLSGAGLSDYDPLVGCTPSNNGSTQTVDSSSLFYIVEVVHRPRSGSAEPLRVHYPIPASIVDLSAPKFGPKVAQNPLSLQEALVMPAPDIADRLVRAFFDVIHVAYPVLDRKTFSRLYRQGKASPLVLQTIFLLGFTVGSDDLVQAAGFSDRVTARRTHYLRAKTLYDADYDKDRMNLVAVMLLLGFWWAGYDEQKDTCHWVGCATTFAQSLGMHRSYVVLVAAADQMTRDRHTSAAFGRPCRVRDEDTDLESLTEADFEFDNDYDESLIPHQQDFHISYVLEMTKLAAILGDVLTAEFSPRRVLLERFETSVLKSELLKWETNLPDHLRMAPLDGYCHILLFRPKSLEPHSPDEKDRDMRARAAADAITRNAEDQLGVGAIRSSQIHLVPALFGALSIHTIVICRKDPIRRQLAENKSRQCLLALSELSKSWPVRIWISKSFVNLMTRLTDQGAAPRGGAIVNVSSSIHNPNPSLHAIEEGQDTPTGIMDTDSGFAHTTQPQDFQPDGEFSHALFYDNFWTSYLDNAFDVDLLIQPN
ncbi:cutinase transcription factor 1 alpha [Colletotrichum musicola]|uniref:Cutinase transcription factor 1 alpha n=1 Tax=Colletotrichum musicola TaxID=2175873 RepID=A0A8H6NF91_9PEZI|nr:cutinase transcription factor 1 alpha [Colletotrichum musicola]